MARLMQQFDLQRLTNPITVTGTDFWNRPHRSLTIVPNAEPDDPQWYWLPTPAWGTPIPITSDIARLKYHRVQLHYDGHFLDMFEHLGAMREHWPGLTIIGSGSPPYFGNGYPFFAELLANSAPHTYTLPVYQVSKRVEVVYSNLRGGHRGFTAIAPRYMPHCGFRVSTHYPRLHDQMCERSLDDLDQFEQVMMAKTVSGFARFGWTYGLSRLATLLLRWPHHDSIAWVQNAATKKQDASVKAGYHAIQDAAGLIIGLLSGDGKFHAEVLRGYSGHWADLEAVRQAARLIVPAQASEPRQADVKCPL